MKELYDRQSISFRKVVMLPISAEVHHAIQHKKPPPRGPYWVQLEISNVCNTRCVFCAMHGPYNFRTYEFAFQEVTDPDAFGYDNATRIWLEERMKTDFMDMELFKKAVDQTLEVGAEDYNLCGLGEPTLNSLYPEMIRYISGLGARVSLDSNGTILQKPGRVDELISLGLYGLHISLNAATEENYQKVNGSRFSLADILSSLKHLNRLKYELCLTTPHVLLSLIVTRENVPDILPFVDIAHSVGAYCIVIDHMVPGRLSGAQIPSGDNRKRVFESIEEAHHIAKSYGITLVTNYAAIDSRLQYRIPCIIGYMFTRIQADGTVQGCCGCPHILGDMKKNSFNDIWYGSLYNRFRNEEHAIHLTHSRVTDCLCGSCPHVVNNIDYLNMVNDTVS
jgi:MoaA/NifB/PqqE/SkfB family radical SAM enzyme